MKKTRYEGVLYRENRRGLKSYYARFKVEGKVYLRKIGDEPKVNAKTASRLRFEMMDEVREGVDKKRRKFDEIFEEYVKLRSPLLSASWAYNMQKSYERHLKEVIGHLSPGEVDANMVQLKINTMLESGYAVSTVKQLKDCIGGMYRYMLPELENVGRLCRQVARVFLAMPRRWRVSASLSHSFLGVVSSMAFL